MTRSLATCLHQISTLYLNHDNSIKQVSIFCNRKEQNLSSHKALGMMQKSKIQTEKLPAPTELPCSLRAWAGVKASMSCTGRLRQWRRITKVRMRSPERSKERESQSLAKKEIFPQQTTERILLWKELQSQVCSSSAFNWPLLSCNLFWPQFPHL